MIESLAENNFIESLLTAGGRKDFLDFLVNISTSTSVPTYLPT